MTQFGGVLLVCLGLALPVAQAAQAPIVELPDFDIDLRNHIMGPRLSIHGEPEKLGLSEGESFMATVELEVVVAENGQVESVHAVKGPEQLYRQAEQIEKVRAFKPFTSNGKSIRVKFHDYVSVHPPEQWLRSKVSFPSAIDLNTVTIRLSRTGCFGSCPAYSVAISGDGTVYFQGRGMVLLPGTHTARVSPDAVQELLGAFRRADFLSAKDRYVAPVTDSSTQTIAMSWGMRTKTVVDYVGSEVGLPDAVEDLERQIDQTAGTDRWVKGTEETLPSLRAEGWDFSSGSTGNMALYRNAIERNDAALVDALLTAKTPVTLPDDTGMPPICQASAKGQIALVRRMLGPNTAGKKVDIDNDVLQMCLGQAARSGNLAMVELWLKLGADPTKKGPGLSAMANAMISGKARVVKRLLQYPVDVHEKVSGETPLLTFAVMGRGNRGSKEIGEVVRMLVKAGATANERGYNGQTPLFAMSISPEAIRALVATGARINARDSDRATPLIYHATEASSVRALLALGADPTLVGRDGETAAEKARRYGCQPCAAMLSAALKRRVERHPRTAVQPLPKAALAR